MTTQMIQVFTLIALTLSLAACQRPHHPSTPLESYQPEAIHVAEQGPTPERTRQLAESDPAAFLQLCRNYCRVRIRDYVCLFVKEELLADGLSPERHMEVHFREDPFSVDLKWTKNPQLASRMSYVKGWQDQAGNPIAHFHLRGGLSLLAPKGVYRCIYADGIGTESRRPIDQFGLCHMLDMMVATNERAAGNPEFSLRFLGENTFNSRPTFLFERKLPYSEGGDWPDRHMLVHIDADHLVPIALFAYADDENQSLLGRYEFRDLRCNVGLTDADFGPPPPANLKPEETEHSPGATP